MVDLFAPTALNAYDAVNYGLSDAVGVRIYHVNARMEQRNLVDDFGEDVRIGTVCVANAANDSGDYHVELLQKGGNNTFTDLYGDLRSQFAPQDFFYAGDRFVASQFTENLVEGKMDDGSEFGYIIEVISITGTEATVRITRT